MAAAAQPGQSHPRAWAGALCAALLSALYFAATSLRAAGEKLWFDEVFEFHAAALLPSIKKLWVALCAVDYSPPLSYVAAFVSERLLGKTELGLRAPSILAFWVMMLCLYFFLRRRTAWYFAVSATLFTSVTAAGRYAYEARPPALVLALAAVALLAWQACAEFRHRTVALPAMAFSLAAALCCHAFAVTLALPLLAGELTRTYKRRQIDWPVWFAFACATPALILLWKLKTTGTATAYWRYNGTIAGNIASTYFQLLRPALAPLLIAAAGMFLAPKSEKASAQPPRGFAAHEIAALVGSAVIPFLAAPLSKLAGHYFLRYSLNAIIGMSGLLALALQRLGSGRRLAGTIAVCAFGVAFVLAELYPEANRPDGGLKEVNSSEEIRILAEQIPADEPLVICQGGTFVELEHYASPQLASRLFYLTEPRVAAEIDGDTLFEVKEPQITKYFAFRAHFEDYHAFIAKHPRFYVIQPIRNIAREYFLGHLALRIRETPSHLQYFEADTTIKTNGNPPIGPLGQAAAGKPS